MKWHNYKNRGRKQSVSFEENPLKSLEDHLQKSISGLQEDILNIKDTIIQHFQESTLKSKKRLISLENEAVELEIKNNSLEQYGRNNNLEMTGIPTTISEDELEKTAVGILHSINVDIDSSNVEVCHYMDKSNGGKLKEIIKELANCKFCKKVSLNRKKNLASVVNNKETQLKSVFINKNLIDFNNIAYHSIGD